MNLSKLGLTLVASAVVALYGCGKEEPKKPRRRRPPRRSRKSSPSRSATPVRSPAASPTLQGQRERRAPRRRAATGKKLKIGGKTVKFELQGEDDQADPKLGPTIAQSSPREGRRRRRPPELGRDDPASAVYNQAGIPMISARRPTRSSPSRASRTSSASSAATTSRARQSRSSCSR